LPSIAASASVRSGASSSRRAAPAAKIPRWRAVLAALPPRAYAGACLAAIAVTIVANAAFFQHRGATSPVSPAAAPVAARAASPAPAADAQPQVASVPAAVPSPPARPTASAPAASANDDPIADLLNGGASKDDKKQIMAAQTALVKLGYVVKVDGDANAGTLQAIADYEKRHSLPVTPSITAHVVKILTAAAGH
jgi:hypothetical protein